MANRRMFNKSICKSTKFLKMPSEAQNLYFHLNLSADDDGVVEAFNVMREIGCNEDNLKILVAKEYIKILNEDLVSYIIHWTEHNSIRADRKINSIYLELLKNSIPNIKLVEPKKRSDLKRKKERTANGQTLDSPEQQEKLMDSPWTTNGQLRLGKDSIGKDSLSKDKIDKVNIDNNISNEIMTEQQLLQAIYIEKIKDKNANNIIECVSYLKQLPIEVIKIALEQAELQKIAEWNYAKEILDKWLKMGIKNISDLQNYNFSENKIDNLTYVTESSQTGGFKRKGDEILNG